MADIEPGELVLVAGSGGADSTALAIGARQAADSGTFRVGAIIIDHGLQPDSAEVAAATATRLRALGLDPVNVVAVVVGTSGGPEAAARTARYEALEQWAGDLGARAVLLGHTLEDQAETVLLGLARGSGLKAIAGMTAQSGPGGLFRRPLLAVERSVTRAACGDAPVWQDPHNVDGRFARVRVRERVLPTMEAELGPGVARALARTAALAAAASEAIDIWVDRIDPVDGIAVSTLAALPVAVRTRFLLRSAVLAGAPAGRLTREHVLAIDRLVTDWRGQGSVTLPGGLSAVRGYGRLGFTREAGVLPAGDQWTPTT